MDKFGNFCCFTLLRVTLKRVLWIKLMTDHTLDHIESSKHKELMNWAKIEGNFICSDVGDVINYPQIATSSNFVRLIAMLLYETYSISTDTDSCLSQNSKCVLILRINLPTNGHNRWTHYFQYPHFMLFLHKTATKPTGMARSYHTKPFLARKLESQIYFMWQKWG